MGYPIRLGNRWNMSIFSYLGAGNPVGKGHLCKHLTMEWLVNGDSCVFWRVISPREATEIKTKPGSLAHPHASILIDH